MATMYVTNRYRIKSSRHKKKTHALSCCTKFHMNWLPLKKKDKLILPLQTTPNIESLTSKIPSRRIQLRQHSFISCTIKIWNSLPLSTVMSDSVDLVQNSRLKIHIYMQFLSVMCKCFILKLDQFIRAVSMTYTFVLQLVEGGRSRNITN